MLVPLICGLVDLPPSPWICIYFFHCPWTCTSYTYMYMHTFSESRLRVALCCICFTSSTAKPTYMYIAQVHTSYIHIYLYTCIISESQYFHEGMALTHPVSGIETYQVEVKVPMFNEHWTCIWFYQTPSTYMYFWWVERTVLSIPLHQ